MAVSSPAFCSSCCWTRTSPIATRATSVPIACKHLFYKGCSKQIHHVSGGIARPGGQSVTRLLRQADARPRDPARRDTAKACMRGGNRYATNVRVGIGQPDKREINTVVRFGAASGSNWHRCDAWATIATAVQAPRASGCSAETGAARRNGYGLVSCLRLARCGLNARSACAARRRRVAARDRFRARARLLGTFAARKCEQAGHQAERQANGTCGVENHGMPPHVCLA